MTDVTNDDAIQIEKKRKAAKLLDGSEDGTDEDENGKEKDIAQDETDEDENVKGKSKGKDIAPEDTLMAEDDSDSAAKITTPSKTHEVTKRTSTRGRPIGSGSKKGCSPPPHILFLFINHFLICCLSLSRQQVSYGKIPGVGQITHVHR